MDVARRTDDEQTTLWNGLAGRPLGLILHEADDRTRTQVIEAVRAAFDPYVHGAEVRFDADCWMVSARASSASAAPKEAASA